MNESLWFINQKQNAYLFSQKLPNLNEFRRILFFIRTAAYVVIALTSGCRNHELASLKIGCFYCKKEVDLDYYFIQGMSTKTFSGIAEWMVPQIAGEAIRIMEEWSKPLRKIMKQRLARINNELSELSFDNQSKKILLNERRKIIQNQDYIFLTSSDNFKKINPLSNSYMNHELKKFMVYCGIDWHLNTHQFRRTFAVFVSKNIFGDLRYLKYHYNHWNMDMTLLYAKNEEQEAKLFDEILESVHEEKIKIVEHWLDDDALISGGAASSLKAYKRNRKVNTKKDRRQLAENISHTVTIRGTGHGWCMADDYGCGGQGIYEATSCINCKNSIIDRNHKETWLGIWRQQLELRQIKDIGPGGKQRVERDIKRIGCLLQNLGIKVENEEVFCEKK